MAANVESRTVSFAVRKFLNEISRIKMTVHVFPDEETVIETCGRLVDLRAWEPTKIDYQGWLSNFVGTERKFALVLLSKFTFLADHLVDQLFRSAFQNLSNMLSNVLQEFDTARENWRTFCSQAVITLVQGEDPNPSDSGWLFARKARQAIGLNPAQLFEPRDALRKLSEGFSGPVVFVDDFVGSGDQFLSTWERAYTQGSSTTSFQEQATTSAAAFYYCNAMTTEYGRDRINSVVPTLRISTGNVIPERYSFAHPDSMLWPETIRGDGIQFLEKIGRQLGYAATDGGEDDWRGFHKLGLAMAFQHSIPDANLPLFFTDRNGWKPLVRRL